MSLLTTASPWNSGNTKKRPSTMRKTIKKMAAEDNDAESEDAFDNFEPMSAPAENTIEKSQLMNDSRSARVNDMLSKMDSLNIDNGGSKLVDFKPPPSPELTSMRKHTDTFSSEITSPDELLPQNPMMPPIPSFFQQAQKNRIPVPVKGAPSYGANDMGLTKFSNYNTTYDHQNILQSGGKPYYAKMGIGSGSDDKLMEKLNYMIHLLEEQQHEKTNNVMEEFILYTFLGVFVIFMSDSFARAGKYVR